MSRYRIQLVPQGTIRRPIEIGVRLTPLGVPPPEKEEEVAPPPPCEIQCSDLFAVGFTSSGGTATTVTGSSAVELAMQGGPWTLQISIGGNNCGEEVTWEFGGSLVEGTDYSSAGAVGQTIWLFGAKGCDPPYAGDLTVQAKLGGEPFCPPMLITFSGAGGGCGSAGECCFTSESGDPCSFLDLSPGVPSIDFTDIGPNSGVGPLYWDIQSVGATVGASPSIGSGDFILYTVSYDGITDINGAVWYCFAYLDEALTMPYCELQVIVTGNA